VDNYFLILSLVFVVGFLYIKLISMEIFIACSNYFIIVIVLRNGSKNQWFMV